MAEAPRVVTDALSTLERVARETSATWALVGGQALVAHGVPRDTLDADALVEHGKLGVLAEALVEAGWRPVAYDPATGDYVDASEPTAHWFQDPVLFDCGEERVMIPFRTPDAFVVELLAAQHPVEREMIVLATQERVQGAAVPVAPLGGVLLVKAKADRTKDIAALEQTAEHLPRRVLDAAVAWARARDPATAYDLESVLRAAQARKVPLRTGPYPGTKRPSG